MSSYICPHGNSECTLGYQTCRKCLERFKRRLTPRERAYDEYVTIRDVAKLVDEFVMAYPTGCSCHINPPCSWCTRDTENE